MRRIVFATVILFSACFGAKAQNFNQYSTATLLNNYGNVTGGGAIISTLNKKENTKGTRYMFDDWVKGNFINAQGTLVNVDSARYNFDKQSNNLIVTTDMKEIISIIPSQLKSATLTDGTNSYNFIGIPSISTSLVFLSLVQDSTKYSLYKSVKTTFEAANYQTNGISESGHSYDEYIDNATYYVTRDNKTFTPIVLKKKAFKDTFASDKDKVNTYMSDHADDDINENYLIGLVKSVNQ